MKILIIAALVGIVASLGHALFAMANGPADSQRVVNSLTVRIVLSVALFILLLVGAHFGWIEPHGGR